MTECVLVATEIRDQVFAKSRTKSGALPPNAFASVLQWYSLRNPASRPYVIIKIVTCNWSLPDGRIQ
jgi:hypothetical protein